MADEEPFDLEEEEQKLRGTLAQMDTERTSTVTAADQAMQAAAAAQATARNEFDEDIATAETAFNLGVTDYAADLATWNQNLSDAQESIEAIEEPGDAQDEIDAIGSVEEVSFSPVTVQTGGIPDCSAADVETAINSAITDIQTATNAVIQELNDELTKVKATAQQLNDILQALGIGDIKTALQGVKDAGQMARNQAVPVEDVEVLKAGFHSALDNFFQ